VAVELAKRPRLLRMIAEAALGRVVTKDDIEKVRGEVKEGIRRLSEAMERLREGIGTLRERGNRLEGSVTLLVRLFIAFNVPILVGIIGILSKLAFGT